MIDFFKISSTNFDYIKLINHSCLKFQGRTDLETNELTVNEFGNKQVEANYYGLKFIIFFNKKETKTLSITGSLHKFYNFNEHNFNDFNYENLIETLIKINDIFDIDLSECKLHNIEIGVNIIPPIKTKTILKGLLSHQNVRFKSIAIDNAEYYQVKHGNYYIKCYDKAKQYKAKGHLLINDILRFELKFIKMFDLVNLLRKEHIIRHDYISLQDLTNVEVLNIFGKLLLKKWNEILFYDYTISNDNLTPLQLSKLDAWQNINKWEGFKKQKKLEEKQQLLEVIKNNSQQLQLQVADLIQKKLLLLLPYCLPYNRFDILQKDDLLTTSFDAEVIAEGLPSNSILKGLNGKVFNILNELFKGEEIVPDYDVFHADTREIPF